MLLLRPKFTEEDINVWLETQIHMMEETPIMNWYNKADITKTNYLSISTGKMMNQFDHVSFIILILILIEL